LSISIEKLEQYIRVGLLILTGSLIFSLFVAQAVAILLIILWLTKIGLSKKANLKNNPFTFPFIAFVIARIISVFLSEDLSQSLQTLNKEIFFYPLFFLVVDTFPIDDKRYVKWFFIVLSSAAIVSSIYGSSLVLFEISERAKSTTSGYYTLGTYLCVVASFLLVIGSDKYFIPSKWIWALSLIVILIGILFTFNRIHWVIIGLIILIFGFLRERKIIFFISLLTIITVIVVPMLRERLLELLFFQSNLSDRDILWKGAGMIYSKHPVSGFGPLTFREIFPLFENLTDKNVSSWHNDYLQVYMESGFIGLITFLWLAISIFYIGIKLLFKKSLDKLNGNLTLAILLAMSAFYLTGTVGTFMFNPIMALLFQILLAILAVIYRNNLTTIKLV
jgi:O-antigen ligase